MYYFPGKKETAELLIRNGVDIDVKDNVGWTPLRAATENSNFECSCFERDNLIHPNFLEHTEVSQFLIENGADTLSLN